MTIITLKIILKSICDPVCVFSVTSVANWDLLLWIIKQFSLELLSVEQNPKQISMNDLVLCSFVSSVYKDGGTVAALWSALWFLVLCDKAISAISSGDKRRESLLSQYGSWPFNSPSVCVTLTRESRHTRYSDTHMHARTHSRDRSNAYRECGRNWQPADGRLRGQ